MASLYHLRSHSSNPMQATLFILGSPVGHLLRTILLLRCPEIRVFYAGPLWCPCVTANPIILVPGNAHIVMLVPHGINVSPKILVYQSPGSINPRYCQYDIHVPPKIPFFQWPENQIVFAVPLWHPWSPKIRSNRYPEFVMIGCYGVHVPPKMRLFLCKEIQISYDCFL